MNKTWEKFEVYFIEFIWFLIGDDDDDEDGDDDVDDCDNGDVVVNGDDWDNVGRGVVEGVILAGEDNASCTEGIDNVLSVWIKVVSIYSVDTDDDDDEDNKIEDGVVDEEAVDEE